tara:strand:- start:19 stop:504 length:486 start_codon:yes stop_codon:yes gene_type:complete
MKRLYVVRHAEASWDDKFLSDYERPLKIEGIKDAEQLGAYLISKKHIPECILYSAAKRTTETAKFIYSKINDSSIDLIDNKSLYESSVNEILPMLESINKNYNSIMLVGHNPTITMLINQLSNAKIDDVPTSGTAIIDMDYTNWTGNLVEFIYPKKLKFLK